MIIQLPVVVQARVRNPKESSSYGVAKFVSGAAIVCGRCCSQTQVIDIDLASTGYRKRSSEIAPPCRLAMIRRIVKEAGIVFHRF